MLARLLERSKTSGREDDNIETIKHRFRKKPVQSDDITSSPPPSGTYEEQTMPVIKYFTALGKVAEVCASYFPKTSGINCFPD